MNFFGNKSLLFFLGLSMCTLPASAADTLAFYVVKLVSGSITLDGKLDEKDWQESEKGTTGRCAIVDTNTFAR